MVADTVPPEASTAACSATACSLCPGILETFGRVERDFDVDTLVSLAVRSGWWLSESDFEVPVLLMLPCLTEPLEP